MDSLFSIATLAPNWRKFYLRQMAQARVLIVDDDPNVGRFLCRALSRQGFSAKAVLSVAEAWPLIESETFDLLLVDKTMPKESGLVLLKRLKDSEHKIPTVIVTGDATSETIDEALSLGAVDYISKPFVSIEHLIRRLRGILDRRTSELLFDVMLGDLSKLVLSGTGQSNGFKHLSKSLLDLKVKLGKRPACAVIDDDQDRRDGRRDAIYEAGVIAISVSPTHIQEQFQPEQPMVAAVSLESGSSLTTIAEIHKNYPHTLVLAAANQAYVGKALAAIEAGAMDFVLMDNEGAAATQRIERLVIQARRHHLYLEIVGMLYQAAREVHPDLAEDLIFTTNEADKKAILRQGAC